MSDNPIDPIEIAGPVLRPRMSGLLLGAADLIPDTDLFPHDPGTRGFSTHQRIVGGVTFCPQGCATLDTQENAWCEDITLPDAGPDTPTAETFASFAVVGREDAPARFDPAYAQSRITQRFDTQISAQLARELLTGAASGSPSLQSEVTAEYATPVDPADVLFYVNRELAALDNARGTIFADPATFELLTNAYDVHEENEVFTTSTGHVLVGDAGFDGSGPDGTSSPGEAWVYAIVGAPLYWLGPRELVGTETANFTRSRNKRSTVYTQQALVAFENCLVVAVNVAVPDDQPGS